MKVLITTHYFPPHHGGIEYVAYNQAKTLAELGHDVTLVTSKAPKVTASEMHGVTVIRVSALNILEDNLGVPYPIFSPRLIGELRKQVRQADIVHSHGHVYPTSVIAAWLSGRYRKPFVLTQHNTFIEYKSWALKTLQRLADRTLGRFTINRATEVVAVSSATQEYLRTISPAKSVILYNGTDVNRFKPAADRTALRKQFSIPSKGKVCFCIRRITFKNGIDTLLRAAELLKDRKDIIMLIGGKGPDLEAAKAYVESHDLTNVRLLGMVSDDDLSHYYAASDVFILPSKNGEGFPLVVLEALASGLPVIATRSGGHVEIIKPGKCGFIVEPNRPDQIAEKIKLILDGDQLASMQRASRRYAEESLSWTKNVDDLLAVFHEAMA